MGFHEDSALYRRNFNDRVREALNQKQIEIASGK